MSYVLKQNVEALQIPAIVDRRFLKMLLAMLAARNANVYYNSSAEAVDLENDTMPVLLIMPAVGHFHYARPSDFVVFFPGQRVDVMSSAFFGYHYGTVPDEATPGGDEITDITLRA